MSSVKPIYLDNNATTLVDPRVIQEMYVELQQLPSNPSSLHTFGKAAANRLKKSRETIASYLHVQPSELLFTSSGTEALNLGIFGFAPKGAIVTSPIEHASIHHALGRLPNEVRYLPIDLSGKIALIDLEKTLDDSVSLLILSAVNSETGVKNPIEEAAKIAKQRGIPFIVDGVALLGKEKFSISDGISAMAFSGHKIHGPKGVGLLFVRKGIRLHSQIIGGSQERGMRAGTENLPAIVGFAKAVELLESELPKAALEMERLRDLLEAHLPLATTNGRNPRVCNTSNLTFPGIDGEALLFNLDLNGVLASMGSACSSGAIEPSRILTKMGLSRRDALSTLRFSLSRFSTEEEILKAAAIIKTLCGFQSS